MPLLHTVITDQQVNYAQIADSSYSRNIATGTLQSMLTKLQSSIHQVEQPRESSAVQMKLLYYRPQYLLQSPTCSKAQIGSDCYTKVSSYSSESWWSLTAYSGWPLSTARLLAAFHLHQGHIYIHKWVQLQWQANLLHEDNHSVIWSIVPPESMSKQLMSPVC